MLNFPRWKVWGISLICLIISLMAVPSFLPARIFDQLPSFARAIHVNLGLDLAGGSQLLLEAETQDVAKKRAETMEDTLRRVLRGASIEVTQLAASNGEVRFLLVDTNRQIFRSQQILDLRIGVGGLFHHVAPMAPHRLQVEDHETLLPSCPREGVIRPGFPANNLRTGARGENR